MKSQKGGVKMEKTLPQQMQSEFQQRILEANSHRLNVKPVVLKAPTMLLPSSIQEQQEDFNDETEEPVIQQEPVEEPKVEVY